VNSLSSLEPQDESITHPNYRLSRLAFQTVVQAETPILVNRHRQDMSIAPSAVDFLQRILEDVSSGTVLRPFKLWHHAPAPNSIRFSSSCIFRHGVTLMEQPFFCLDDVRPNHDDDDDKNKNDDGDHGDTSDSDADYDPNLSDMDESDGDDNDDDEDEPSSF
jgi:hypothetical protein